MNDFLIKPFDPDTLFATLLRALRYEYEITGSASKSITESRA
jgi:DNA-binding NtrC family response regulator